MTPRHVSKSMPVMRTNWSPLGTNVNLRFCWRGSYPTHTRVVMRSPSTTTTSRAASFYRCSYDTVNHCCTNSIPLEWGVRGGDPAVTLLWKSYLQLTPYSRRIKRFVVRISVQRRHVRCRVFEHPWNGAPSPSGIINESVMRRRRIVNVPSPGLLKVCGYLREWRQSVRTGRAWLVRAGSRRRQPGHERHRHGHHEGAVSPRRGVCVCVAVPKRLPAVYYNVTSECSRC